MPREPLPLECLLNILHVLASQYPYDTDTMARLLRVSKTFCAATLPFLYRDCFKTCIRKYRYPQMDAIVTTIQMTRTLLRQVHPQNRISGLLRVTYLSQDGQDGLESTEQQSPSPLIFKYGRFIRRIVPQWNNWGRSFINSLVMEYATTHQLFDQYVAEGVLSDNIHNDSKSKALENALKMDIHRQLIWMLCQDHMDTIEELAIPLFDVERYIEHADRFTSLSNVIFSCDNDTKSWDYKRATRGEEDSDLAQKMKNEKRNRYSTGMLKFVRQHTLIHKNVLRYVEADRHTAPDLFFEIQALLPPLHNPQSIDGSNWINFAGRMKDTNLNHVESIALHLKSEVDHEGWGSQQEKAYEIFRNQPFLPRCRVLKELKMDTLGPDMFQWAVQEKKQIDEARQRKRIASQHSSTRQHGYHDNDFVPLVPLRSVTIGTKEWLQLPVQEVNDIAFAFSDTLEGLSMEVRWYKDEDEYEHLAGAPQVVYGRDWDLPHLRNLMLSVSHFQLHFDMNGLGRCHALESVRLRDEIVLYNHREIRSWSPVSLPHLKELDLQGSPALHFNMDSLHHSPCVETLRLDMQSIDPEECCYYIPSAEELERDNSDNQVNTENEVSGMPDSNQGLESIGGRPQYTWDWHLPNLWRLELAAVFAFQFDFQWLQYLPNLGDIRLDMKSFQYYGPSVTHERRITLKDISRGQQLHQQDEDGSEETLSDQFISLPKLTKMYLDGQWNFEEKVVETICSFMAPNLEKGQFGMDTLARVGRVPEQEKYCGKKLVFFSHDKGYFSIVV